MGMISSISGPPMALLYQDSTGTRLRGTLSGYFVASTIVFLIGLGAIGRFGRAELQLALALMPGVFIGFAISGLIVPVVDRGYTRLLVLTLSSITALVIVFRQVL
jgi:uncharacterized membrane protein YfcA